MKLFFKSAALLYAALILLTGCSQLPDRYAGGDDYPNGVKPLAQHAATERSDSSEWNSYQDAPSHPDGLYDSTWVPEAIPQIQSPTSPDTLRVSTDSVSGRITRIYIHHTDSLYQIDSTIYKLGTSPSPLLIRESGFTHDSATGLENRYDFEDGDGDGILSARSQAQNIAVIHLQTIFSSGMRQEKDLRIEAGADLDFNLRGDNRLLSLETRTISGTDTLSHVTFTNANASANTGANASSDSALIDFHRTSNLVDIVQKTRDPVSASTTTLFYRLAIFADFHGNYSTRYHRLFSGSGGTEETWALGRDSLPDFAAGDSGYVVSVLTPAASDTLSQSRSLYRVLLDNTAGHSQGDHLLSVDRVKSFRLGTESKLHFHLDCETPVSSTGYARTGALTTRLDFKDGTWIQLLGQADSTEIFGTLTDSEGRQGTLHLDFTGQIKSTTGY